MSKLLTYLSAAVFVLSSLVLSACGGGEDSVAGAESPAVPVELAVAEAMDVAGAVSYTGTVRGDQRAVLSTRLTGRIVAVPVEAGDRVRRGQVLARIQSDNVQAQRSRVDAQLGAAEVALANAETHYRRIETLVASQSATQVELDQAQTQRAAAQAQVDALKAQQAEVADALGYATLRAPFSGYVVERQAEVGALAAPGQPLIVVEGLGRLEVVVSVPESDITKVGVGDTISVEVDAAGGAVRTAIVTQVNPSGDALSRQYEVQARLLGETEGLRSGMYARVTRATGGHAATAVPVSALVERGQLTGLYTVTDDGYALLRWVRTGRRVGDRVEILSGLTQGERFVARADGPLVDGALVSY